MDDRKPWQPHLKHLPVFNPFETSMAWQAQMGANDEIEIEDESSPESPVRADLALEKTRPPDR